MNNSKSTSPATAVATAPTVRKPRANKRCVSSVARQMVVDGKTNEQIWEILVNEFKLDEAKKSYPKWYRNEMLKKGFIDDKGKPTAKKLPPIVEPEAAKKPAATK